MDKSTALDPIDYWKFKAALLGIIVQEQQLQAQMALLDTQKRALLEPHAIPFGPINFDDAACAIRYTVPDPVPPVAADEVSVIEPPAAMPDAPPAPRAAATAAAADPDNF